MISMNDALESLCSCGAISGDCCSPFHALMYVRSPLTLFHLSFWTPVEREHPSEPVNGLHGRRSNATVGNWSKNWRLSFRRRALAGPGAPAPGAAERMCRCARGGRACCPLGQYLSPVCGGASGGASECAKLMCAW